MPPLEQGVSDATQRVNVNPTNIPPRRPQATPQDDADSVRRNVNSQRKAALSRKRRNRRIALIAIIAGALAVLTGIIIAFSLLFFKPADDNGLILNNVFVAGVNLGNMTVEQAEDALQQATANTYTKLDMKVQVLDSVLTLSPDKTGAKLDIQGAVQAAYNYGRSGSRADRQKAQQQANASGYTVPLLSYLNLNTDYILSEVNALGEKYSTTLKQTTYTLQGQRPSMEQNIYDTSIEYQTLVIHIGTAEYGMSVSELYQQILDAYNINLFQVSGSCTMVAPDALDCTLLYDMYCVEPENAYYDESIGDVVREKYGYGFLLDDLNNAVNNAVYGETVRIPLKFIMPSITKEFYNEIYRDTLGSYTTDLPDNVLWNDNIRKAANTLNGYVLGSGEEFSFNQLLGSLTAAKGYSVVDIFVGKSTTQVRGGGVCQLASTLYNCALLADLDILERHTHSYAPEFIDAGFDAEVVYGSMDLRFKNTTDHPIRIEISVTNNKLTVKLVGTDNKDYSVRVHYKIDKTILPETVYSTILENNPSGCKDGDILAEGITGYTVSVYKYTYTKNGGQLISDELVAKVVYAKRDRVVVKIDANQQPDNPDNPDDPDIPVDGPTDDPVDPTVPPVDTPVSPDPGTGETPEVTPTTPTV